MSGLSPEPLSASRRSSLSLGVLQSKMKCDPDGYETELTLVYRQFNSAIDLFRQQAALNFGSMGGVGGDPAIAKDLGDRALFLAHVTPFYRTQLAEFPSQLTAFLESSARTLPSGPRCSVTQALIQLVNQKMVDIRDTLALFMELQMLGDSNLRKLAFSNVVHSIKRLNQNHKNGPENRALQSIMFSMLQEEDEKRAKRSLITVCELHRRKVWFDERTANAICTACLHPSSRIMIAALSFLLDYEKIEDDNDSDASSDEDDLATQTCQVVVNKEAVYKAHRKGTTSSKKKKKAKLERAIRSMKRQQRLSSERSSSTHYSPLNHLIDAQEFAEKLRSRYVSAKEHFKFKVNMMMLKVIARTIGLHQLILPDFYEDVKKKIHPGQSEITNFLAAAVEACHDMVPPDDVKSLFKHIVNEFVHDRLRPEVIAVGLNVIREICLRMPLLMTEDLLQDLVLYKKSRDKPVSAAARSLVTLFREVCPSLLVKKDRGRPSDPKARPREYGEVNIPSSIPGVELLHHDNDDNKSGDCDGAEGFELSDSNGDHDVEEINGSSYEQNQSSTDCRKRKCCVSKLEAHMRQKLSKKQRLALVRAGREERGKYMARTAVKQKKTGGLSNQQKEHKKVMPSAAAKVKASRSREMKKKKKQLSGKQFRGRKAWK